LRIENLFYREAASFFHQVERYFDAFGREHVHVILYDDLCINPARVYRHALEFLGVNAAFEPSFKVSNPNKQVRCALIQRLVYRPPFIVRKLVPKLRRYQSVRALRDRVTAVNSHEAPRPPMDSALRCRLAAEFVTDIQRLGKLIDRDLSRWFRG
jgi:hypothetical protein